MVERWQKVIVATSVAVAVAVVLWRLVEPPRSQPREWRSAPPVSHQAAAGRSAPSREIRGMASAAKPKAAQRIPATSPTVAKHRIAELEETSIPQGRATLVVTVLDRRNDSPVAGVRLEASRWESLDVLASHDFPQTLARLGVTVRPEGVGGMRLADVPAPSRVWLRLGANGYESVEVGPIELPADGVVVRQVYFLSPRASVVGRVVEKEKRTPIAGARVWLATEDWADSRVNTTTSHEDGRFELRNVPSGRRYLCVRAPFSAPEAVVDVSVLPGRQHDLGDVEISLRGAVLYGRVLRGLSSEPVTSTAVELVAQAPADRDLLRTLTNGKGEFRFEGLPNGAFALNLPEFSYSRPLLLAPDEEREIVVRLGGTTLRGHLRVGSKPVAGSIALTRGPHGMGPVRSAIAGDDGAYELQGLEPGRWTVSLWGAKAAFATEMITIPNAPVIEKDFVLATGKVSGRVVEATGAPVPNARVECAYLPEHPYAAFLTPRVVAARTDPEGKFELGPLPEGTFSVRAEHPTEGYGISPPVSVPRTGNSAPVEIKLERVRGATLRSVALSFETGAPIREAFLVLYDAAGRVARSVTRNDAGVAEVRGLAPGTYRVEVSASGYTSDVRTIELHEGETRTVESVLAVAGAVRVWAEDTSGQAIEGAGLKLEPTDPTSTEEVRYGTSELGGLWVCRGLVPGTYRLTVNYPSGGTATYAVHVRPREVTEIIVRPR